MKHYDGDEFAPSTCSVPMVGPHRFARYAKHGPTLARREPEEFEVNTREGLMRGKAGDWLAMDSEGMLYPIADSVFKATYREIEEVDGEIRLCRWSDEEGEPGTDTIIEIDEEGHVHPPVDIKRDSEGTY